MRFAVHTVIMKRRNMKVVILVVYVDDMVITGSNVDNISQLNYFLKRSLS